MAAENKPELGKKFKDSFYEGLYRLRADYRSDNELAGFVGISQPTISKMALKNQEPRLDAVARILDLVDAEVVFPWSKRNETRRLAIDGRVEAGEFRAVDRYLVRGDKLERSEEVGAVLAAELLQRLAPTLSVGMVNTRELQVCTPLLDHGDDLLLDFTAEPEPDASGIYLLRAGGVLECARVSVAEQAGALCLVVEQGNGAPRLLTQGQDFAKLADVILGKAVYRLAALCG